MIILMRLSLLGRVVNEDSGMPLFAQLIFLFVFGTLGYILWQSRRLMVQEQGVPLLHRFTAAGAISSMRINGPFIQLRLYEPFMVVSTYKKILLYYDEIERIEQVSDRMNRYVRIYHTKSEFPVLQFTLTTKGNSQQLQQIINDKIKK